MPTECAEEVKRLDRIETTVMGKLNRKNPRKEHIERVNCPLVSVMAKLRNSDALVFCSLQTVSIIACALLALHTFAPEDKAAIRVRFRSFALADTIIVVQ